MALSPAELGGAVGELRDLLPGLSLGDRRFAESLTDFYLKKGHLSDKQAYWVEVLLGRALGLGNPVNPATGLGGSGDAVSNCAAIFNLFAVAVGNKLKHPKIKFHLPDIGDLQLARAGHKSKHPGSIHLTNGGKYYGNTWYGTVSPDGKIYWSGSATSEKRAAILAFLNALAADPAGIAGMMGHKTGSCCFCSKTLDTEESLSVGYGPVCADHYGLPWGKVARIDKPSAVS
jgi:hypothetical protein